MDTNKMPAEMEAQFDAAFRAKFGCGIAEVAAAQHEDSMALMGAAMWAWQASREAVVVDLSDLSRCFSPNDCGDWAMWLDDVKKLIEAKGLKVAL